MSRSSRQQPKNKHFVFIVMAHGAMRSNLIKIDTRDTRYYDFGKEMHTLVSGVRFSDFAKNTPANAIQHLKTNRGVASQGSLYKFENIVDDSVPEAYIFDRDLEMFPFVTDEDSIVKYKLLEGDDPAIFSVGVHEVNPDINQDLLFSNLSNYRHLNIEARTELIKIANDIRGQYNSDYNRILSTIYIASVVASIVLPVPTMVQLGVLCVTLYKYFFRHFSETSAFKELTKNSVIPIVKQNYTMSEIMSELRKIPKYRHGIHHIIVSSCFGGLTNSQEIEQVLKIQQNEARMNLDVHESFYVDAKKIYDLSSEHHDISPDSPIYSLLQKIENEKTNIETAAPIEKSIPFYKRVLCLFKSETKPKKCALYQNNVTIETIIAICNITKLWLQILDIEPRYLDERHKKYLHAYNAKYMCSQSIGKDYIDRILQSNAKSTPVFNKYVYRDPALFLENLISLQPQPEMLRCLIEQNIKMCIFFQNKLDNIYNLVNEILLGFGLKIELLGNMKTWIEYTEIFSRKISLVSLPERQMIVENLGTEDNKEMLRIMALPDYVDIEAKSFVDNELEIENITQAEYEKAYTDAKILNFNGYIDATFYAIAYDFNTRHIIYDIPSIDKPGLRRENWNSLLTQPLFIIFSQIVETLVRMDKFDYIIQHHYLIPM